MKHLPFLIGILAGAFLHQLYIGNYKTAFCLLGVAAVGMIVNGLH